MAFNDIIKKVQSTLTDPTTSDDILLAIREQNQLLARLVSHNEFSKSETDNIHKIPFSFSINTNGDIVVVATIVPALPNYEIHLNTWNISAEGNIGTPMVSIGYNIDKASYTDKAYLFDKVQIRMGYSHQSRHGYLIHPFIVQEQDGPLQYKADKSPQDIFMAKVFLTVTGYYYSRKNQPQWISPS